MTAKKAAPASSEDAITETQRLMRQVSHINLMQDVNEEIVLFNNTRDGRFLWRAFVLLHKAGEPMPPTMLDVMAEWGRKLQDAASPVEIARALDLYGTQKKHIGPAHGAAYRKRWMVASEVRLIQEQYRVPLKEAISVVARNGGLSVPKVKKDYHAVFTAPLKKKNTGGQNILAKTLKTWR